MRKSAVLSIASALLMVSVSACGRKAEENQQAATQESEAPTKGVDRSHAGQAMPSTDILNADDDTASLGDAKGRPVLVNMWATWCGPCVKELPTLDALSRRSGAPRIIAVSEDIGERASVEAFLNEHGIKTLEVWRDPKMALSIPMGVQVMPTSIYYDASGREVWRYVGDLDWTGAEATKLLAETALAAGAH